MDLYRYMSFESFVDLIISSQLTFVSPLHKWDDKCEGFLYRCLKYDKENTVEKIASYCEKSQGLVEKRITELCDRIRCQCWTREKDSVAMWSIYSHGNKTIMVSIDYDMFKKEKIKIKEVIYEEKFNLDDEIKKCMDNKSIRVDDIFLVKREAFRHENEYRAFMRANSDDVKCHSIKKDISNISEFIKSVTVHPNAEDWYVSTVEILCKNYGITFEGKSQVYEFQI